MMSPRRLPMRRFPAIAAVVIQAIAAVPTLGLVAVMAHAGVPLSLYGAAVLQGTLAFLGTLAWRLAPWWRPIQFVFPVAIVAAQRLHLPPALSLGVFVFLLLVFWSTFRTQVPFYPSGRAVWDAVAALLPPDRHVRLIDIGSGLGGLVLHLARRDPGGESVGIELAPLPWLVSRLRAHVSGSKARFIRGNYERVDFAEYDVVFAYLSPAAMPALWRKATLEMRPASMLLSFEFPVEDKPPDRIVAAGAAGPALYVWYF